MFFARGSHRGVRRLEPLLPARTSETEKTLASQGQKVNPGSMPQTVPLETVDEKNELQLGVVEQAHLRSPDELTFHEFFSRGTK